MFLTCILYLKGQRSNMNKGNLLLMQNTEFKTKDRFLTILHHVISASVRRVCAHMCVCVDTHACWCGNYSTIHNFMHSSKKLKILTIIAAENGIGNPSLPLY